MRPSMATSPHGHNVAECVSALQKCIRRSMDRDAAYWAAQIDQAGFTKHLWKRLNIIATEDIGLADPQAAIYVNSLYQTWKEHIAPDTGHMFAIAATIYLARAPKSRIADWSLFFLYQGAEGDVLDVPDIALDNHTSRGRRMGRGPSFFLEESSKLMPESTVPDEEWYRSMAAAAASSRRTHRGSDGTPSMFPDAEIGLD